jgi:diacylglycerol kinase (ATP)
LPYRRAVVIYNPAAGRSGNRRQRALQDALVALKDHAAAVEAVSTTRPQAACKLAEEACRRGADLVLVCGGDGTVNEAVNGLAHSGVPMAVLPAGTANVLAAEAGIPADPVQAARALPGLEPRRIALGRVSTAGRPPRYFLLVCGAGLDARIVYRLNLWWKSRLGIGAYWLAALPQLVTRQTPFRVTAAGREYECTFALAARARNYGGNLRIARSIHLLAGGLEIVLFHARSGWRYARYLAGAATGTLHRMRDVTFLEAQRLELRPADGSRVHVETDGEYAGCLPATIEIVPDALTLLLPPCYPDAAPSSWTT